MRASQLSPRSLEVTRMRQAGLRPSGMSDTLSWSTRSDLPLSPSQEVLPLGKRQALPSDLKYYRRRPGTARPRAGIRWAAGGHRGLSSWRLTRSLCLREKRRRPADRCPPPAQSMPSNHGICSIHLHGRLHPPRADNS